MHIRSGLAICLVFMNYEYTHFYKSNISILMRLATLGIHMGAFVYLLIDIFHSSDLKINSIFDRSSIIIFGLGAVLYSNLLFEILVRYQRNTLTEDGVFLLLI